MPSIYFYFIKVNGKLQLFALWTLVLNWAPVSVNTNWICFGHQQFDHYWARSVGNMVWLKRFPFSRSKVYSSLKQFIWPPTMFDLHVIIQNPTGALVSLQYFARFISLCFQLALVFNGVSQALVVPRNECRIFFQYFAKFTPFGITCI